MTRKRAFGAFLLALCTGVALAAGDGTAAAQPPAAAATAQAAAAQAAPETQDRRILVMLHLPAEHYRPASDYGAGGGYGDAAAAQARKRLAARLARENGLQLAGNWPMPILGIDCVVMVVPEGRSPEAVAEHMTHLAGVDWAQPMHEFETQGAVQPHNDSLFAGQPAAQEWKLSDLHRMATGRGVKVAVIDSRVDMSHPDLRGRLIDNQDFVGSPASSAEAHGTGVAGIIGARADNALGIVGVAPGAELMGLRACWQNPGQAATICDTLSLAKAITYAVEHHANVINLSLTGPRDPLLTRLVQVGLDRGAAIVAAVDPRTGSGFPASIPGVIAVAQEGLAAGRAGVYNAPGRDIPTTEPGGRWYLVSGNSYAAAHVSGLLALMRERSSKASQRLLVSSRDGGGLIDACRTLARTTGQADRLCQSAR
ncbi:MAG TPA: S8 family serine peptidase [Allosphingosinicella sp.]|jgi:subtilisin family serine protease|nr:S8 family serine peptidase [Allosphingosinicella sp.]